MVVPPTELGGYANTTRLGEIQYRSIHCGVPTSKNPLATELGERDTPSPARPLPPTTSCNCEELLSVDCQLETKELWDKFHDLGTEMIITKTGR